MCFKKISFVLPSNQVDFLMKECEVLLNIYFLSNFPMCAGSHLLKCIAKNSDVDTFKLNALEKYIVRGFDGV